MKNERYILTDGLVYITPNGNWTRDPMMAWALYRREDAQQELDRFRPQFGTSLKIKRLNLDTGGVR